MFEERIIQEIIHAWELDQNHPHRGRKDKPIPKVEDVQEIIEKSFLASMQREEEKPVTFCLAYLNRDDAEREKIANGFRQVILTFDKVLPLTVDSLSKIAPAFDPKVAALIIGKDLSGSNTFHIWGAMFFGPDINRFTEIPVSIEGFNLVRPDVLMVTARHAGTLLVTRGSSQIGSFVFGKFLVAAPTPQTSEGLANQLIRNITDFSGFQTFAYRYWHVYRDSLDYLLAQAADRGHGAIILIIPDHLQERAEKSIIKKYSFPESPGIENLIYQTTYRGKDITGYIVYKKFLQEHLEFLAQLAAVDGALILRPSFDVLSFGSTLQAAAKWPGRIRINPDGFGGEGEDFDASKLGTRHNSTVDFVGAFPGVIGFVISQDGPTRAFLATNKNTIFCWPDCLTSTSV